MQPLARSAEVRVAVACVLRDPSVSTPAACLRAPGPAPFRSRECHRVRTSWRYV